MDRSYVEYSSPTLNDHYNSSYEESTTILDGYAYVFTDWFLKGVLQGPILPDNVIESFDLEDISGFVDTVIAEWWTIFTYNWAICVCLVIGVLLTFIMPIAGIIWCIMKIKMKGQAYQSPEIEDDWGSSLCRQLVKTFFVFFWALALFALVWHFQANVFMGRGFKDSPNRIDDVLDDSRLYLNNTAIQVDYWRLTNYEELQQGFQGSIEDMQKAVGATLVDFMYKKYPIDFQGQLDLTAMSEEVSTQYPSQKPFLEEALASMKETSDLESNFDAFEGRVSQYLNDPSVCSTIQETCDSLSTSISTWKVDLNLIPSSLFLDMSFTVAELNSIKEQGVKLDGISKAIGDFNSSFILNNAEPVIEVLDQVGLVFQEEVGKISDIVVGFVFEDPNISDDIHDIINQWFNVALNCLLIPGYVLIIVLLIYFVGFFLGLFRMGKAGARTLCSGTALFFIFSWLFWIVTLALFITGSTIQKLGCDTFEDPQNAELFHMFDREFDKLIHRSVNDSRYDNVTWSVEKMIEQCQDEESIYTILRLDVLYDVDQLIDWTNYVDQEASLEKLNMLLAKEQESLGNLFGYSSQEISIIVDPMNQLAQKWLDLETNVFKPIGELTLDGLVGANIIRSMKADLDTLETILSPDQFEPIQLQYEQLADHSLTSFETSFNVALETISDYEKTTQYDSQSVGKRLKEMISDMESAVDKVKNEKSIQKELAIDFEDTTDLITAFGLFSSLLVKTDLGKCGPMYNIYDSALQYACRDFVQPLNSIWSGIGLILICFIPLLPLASSLEAGYRNQKARSRQKSVKVFDLAENEDGD